MNISPIIQTPEGLFERREILSRLDLLIDVFNAKGNDRGLNIVMEAFDEVRYKAEINDRKWKWLVHNVFRHGLPQLEPWDATQTQTQAKPDPTPFEVATEQAHTSETETLVNEIYVILSHLVDKLEELRKLK